jgi:hypothetical protein
MLRSRQRQRLAASARPIAVLAPWAARTGRPLQQLSQSPVVWADGRECLMPQRSPDTDALVEWVDLSELARLAVQVASAASVGQAESEASADLWASGRSAVRVASADMAATADTTDTAASAERSTETAERAPRASAAHTATSGQATAADSAEEVVDETSHDHTSLSLRHARPRIRWRRDDDRRVRHCA